jgi:hypothetical protein
MDPAGRQLRMGLGGAATLAALSFVGLQAQSHTDFDTRKAAFNALRDGDIAGFLNKGSIEAGSDILRAPFILLPNVWGGGDLALYRIMALPCLLAALALGMLLWRRADATAGARASLLALLVVVANPFLLSALLKAHSEEALGACLCIGAVIAAGRSKTVLAMVLLGLAVANKPWAIVAIPAVLLAIRTGRMRALVIMAVTSAAVFLPLVIRGGSALQGTLSAAHTSGVFQPWQVWWFFGDADHPVRGVFGDLHPLYRAAPHWVGPINHPIAVLVPLAFAALLARRLQSRPWHECLLLLALALLLRCMFDVWNISYYQLPFVLSLVAWEVYSDRGIPVLSAVVTMIGWFILALLPLWVPGDVSAIAYLAWSVPLALMIILRLWDPGRFPIPRFARRARARPHPSSIASPSATAGVPSGRS